jgi:hypothetical protein
MSPVWNRCSTTTDELHRTHTGCKPYYGAPSRRSASVGAFATKADNARTAVPSQTAAYAGLEKHGLLCYGLVDNVVLMAIGCNTASWYIDLFASRHATDRLSASHLRCPACIWLLWCHQSAVYANEHGCVAASL